MGRWIRHEGRLKTGEQTNSCCGHLVWCRESLLLHVVDNEVHCFEGLSVFTHVVLRTSMGAVTLILQKRSRGTEQMPKPVRNGDGP
jgi:hypothetical protein